MVRARRLSLVPVALAALALSVPTAVAQVPAAPPATSVAATSEEPVHQATTLQPTATPQGPQAEGIAAPTLQGSIPLPDGVTVVGLRWEGTPEAQVRLRVRDGSGWSPWRAASGVLEVDQDQPMAGAWATEGDVLLDAHEVQVEVTGLVTSAELDAWTGQVTEQDEARVDDLQQAAPEQAAPEQGLLEEALPDQAATPDRLVVASRADWGADESLRNRGGPHVHAIDRLGVTLHHTATQATYTQAQVPAMLRSIYFYHAQTLGWGDVGYHALVDSYGGIWEGRAGGLERTLSGAHATGMNTPWFGISALGNHEITTVANLEMRSLAATIAWVLNHNGRWVHNQVRFTNPTYGWTRDLPAVHGHNQVGSTACPGLHLRNSLPALRNAVAVEQGHGRQLIQRVGGANRYEVASQMAQSAFLGGASTVYLVQGDSLADALGVGPVAARTGAAVLLTQQNAVPSTTLAALTQLRTQRVVLVGGTAAISPSVEQTLRNRGLQVSRVGGPTRFDTAARLTQQMPTPAGGTVYLANGYTLLDGLGGAAAAAQAKAPLLLTGASSLPPETAQRLVQTAPSRVVVLGGTSAVGTPVVDQLRKLLPSARVDRIGGADRYATSALVARDAFTSAPTAVVASGTAPVDAMVGTQLAAARQGPVLLVRPRCRPSAVHTAYTELGISLTRLSGGSTVLDWTAGSTRC